MYRENLTYCCLAIVVLIATAVVSSPVGGRPSGLATDDNRHVIGSVNVAISRPDSTWTFEADASTPPVVARMRSADGQAEADVQVVQLAAGTALEFLIPAIEQAVAAQLQEFNKLSGRRVEINGLQCHDLMYTGLREGELCKFRMLVCMPGDTLYAVKCVTSLDSWDRYEADFDSVINSFEIVASDSPADEASESQTAPADAQAPTRGRRFDQDPTINNLLHHEGYETTTLGDLGRVTKVGRGPVDMILIAGSGFGGDIFDVFMYQHRDDYTMYAVTLAGFGGTAAPPMPAEGVSYAEQTWIRAAQEGVGRLIVERRMERPVVVGHWISGTQVAMGLAKDNPDDIAAVVIISGIPKNITAGGPTLNTPAERATYMDRMAQVWFKTVTRDTWDDNNFYPHDYARDPVRALQLWRQAFEPTVPVWVRYMCEVWAQDSTHDLSGLTVPTLILIPGFDEDFYFVPGLDYMRAFCQDTWEGVEAKSDMVTAKVIDGARVSIMDDQPEKLDQAIREFLATLDEATSQ